MVANYWNATEQEVKEQLHLTMDIKITMTEAFFSILLLAWNM